MVVKKVLGKYLLTIYRLFLWNTSQVSTVMEIAAFSRSLQIIYYIIILGKDLYSLVSLYLRRSGKSQG